MKRRGNKIVTSSIEHSSILEAMKQLEKEGFEVVYLSPKANGKIDIEDLKNTIDRHTILVSIMAVNNEIGSVNPVEKIKNIIEKNHSPALFHIDAVQMFGKMPIKAKKLGADMITASSHKIHGPKGAGLLYIKKGTRVIPLHYGGEQEKKIRPGTECLPALCGMGAAIEELPDMSEEWEIISSLNKYCRSQLMQIENICINSSEDCLPYILNFSVKGIRSETMLHFLADKGIYVSSGSACAKGKKSHVLTAMGFDNVVADSALRVSFSRYNSYEDVDELVNALTKANITLARIK